MTRGRREAFVLSLVQWYRYGTTIYKLAPARMKQGYIPNATQEEADGWLKKYKNPVNNVSFNGADNIP